MQINSHFTSPNYSARIQSIDYIVLHYTEMPFEEALNKLCDKKSEVSCHYFIKDDGEVLQIVDDKNIAWHAGESYWQGDSKLNENSIGIELDNLGNLPFTTKQIKSCIQLCQMLIKKHNISASNIIGHSDIAPSRKIDPGIFFNWEYLAENGLGKWPNLKKTDIKEEVIFNFADKGEEVAELQTRLSKLGYKIDIAGQMDLQTNFVIRAFQSHFYPEIILKQGIDFYRDNNSLYSWDSFSDALLDGLIF